LQLRIYANKDDTSPLNLNENDFTVELKQPTYENVEFDEYDIDMEWADEVENEFFIMHEENQSGTLDLADGTPTDIDHYAWIDQWVNKEYTRPDVLEFTFTTQGNTELLVEGKYVFSYLQFNKESDTSGTK